ncbi:MAG TPA: hypothetical protein VFD03_06835 [Clostridia bacterium]|nr:hypothetical protein [Clostridia bacterium]
MGYAGKELFLYRSLDNGLSWTIIKKINGTICKSIIAGSLSSKNKGFSNKLYITTTSSLYEIDVNTLDSVEKAIPVEAKFIKGADSGFDPTTGLAVLYILAETRFTDDGTRIKGYNFKWGHNPIMDPYNDGMMYITTFGGSVLYGPKEGYDVPFENITPI